MGFEPLVLLHGCMLSFFFSSPLLSRFLSVSFWPALSGCSFLFSLEGSLGRPLRRALP